MFWNGLATLANGQPADGVVGDEFTASETRPNCCGRIKVDAAGRLWVLGFEGKHFLDVYQLPLTNYSVPIYTIWKQSAVFPVLGTANTITFGSGIHGIAPVDDGRYLWLSDTDNHRVLRIRDPLSNPVVDVVLGQENSTSTQCNRGRFPGADPPSIDSGGNTDVLCFPGALSIDKKGNLYVSDHALEINGNRRLLIFSAESTPTINSETIFGPKATKAFTHSPGGPTNLWTDPWEPGAVMPQHSRTFWGYFSAATWEPAFDSLNRMAVGYNGYLGPRFVGVYADPLGPEKYPVSFLYDFGSMAYSATFDDNDNLYVGDINRGRVLVYYNPFSGPGSLPSESPTSLASLPEYPIEIASVDSLPPNCVLAEPASHYQTDIELVVEGLAGIDDAQLEFRKVASGRRHRMSMASVQTNQDASLITIRGSGFWKHTWPGQDRLVMTVRVVSNDGEPLSNWSPAFVVADDVTSCGAAILASSASGLPVPPAARVASTTFTAQVKRNRFSAPAVHLAHNIPDLQVTTADQVVSCDFLAHYESTGAVTRWGHAISEVFEERPGVLTQYYQRGVVDCQQRHGVWRIERRLVWDYVGGGLAGSPDLGVEPDLISEQPGTVHGPFGHRVSNLAVDGTDIGFLDFFEANGGVAAFGYPKTDARSDDHPQAVLQIPGAASGFIRQYFQAAVLEYHPGSQQPVKLRLLGDVVRDRLYPDASFVAYSSFGPMPPLSANQAFVPEAITRS